MIGSVGILPAIGLLGSSFGGGGMFGLGFTLLSGMLGSVIKPKHPHPGFANETTSPGFNNFTLNPGFRNGFGEGSFGSLYGGPSAQTVGSMSHYFGNGYSANGYQVAPPTSSGMYHAQAGYHFGNHGVTYAVPQHGYQQHGHFQQGFQQGFAPQQFGGQFGFQQGLSQLHFAGDIGAYHQGYQQMAGYYPSYPPAFQTGQTMAHFGGVHAPFQQSLAPMMGGYGFGGGPQNFNPASVLYGHSSGAVQFNYAPNYSYQPQVIVIHYGGPPQDEGTEYPTPQPEYPAPQPEYPAPAPDPKPVVVRPTPVQQKPNIEVKPKPAPVAIRPTPTPPATTTVQPGRTDQVSPQPTQTTWSRVPMVNVDGDWAAQHRFVAERVTGGDSFPFAFGGRDPRNNPDGLVHERMGTWHVFQQNQSLRLDAKTGFFYETKPDGSKTNRFHLSAISDIERQAGGDWLKASRDVGAFLQQRNLLAPGLNVVGSGSIQTPNTGPTIANPAQNPVNLFGGINRLFG